MANCLFHSLPGRETAGVSSLTAHYNHLGSFWKIMIPGSAADLTTESLGGVSPGTCIFNKLPGDSNMQEGKEHHTVPHSVSGLGFEFWLHTNCVTKDKTLTFLIASSPMKCSGCKGQKTVCRPLQAMKNTKKRKHFHYVYHIC